MLLAPQGNQHTSGLGIGPTCRSERTIAESVIRRSSTSILSVKGQIFAKDVLIVSS